MTRRTTIINRISRIELLIGGYRDELERLKAELLDTPPELLDMPNGESVTRQLRHARRRETRKTKNNGK